MRDIFRNVAYRCEAVGARWLVDAWLRSPLRRPVTFRCHVGGFRWGIWAPAVVSWDDGRLTPQQEKATESSFSLGAAWSGRG